jgi:hypothetical protein
LVISPAVAQADDEDVEPEAREEAGQRYKRALELFNDGTYDASLAEFQRAYELAPSYRILYNIALVNVQMNDYAGALSAFERFIEEGGDKVDEARRKSVESTLEVLRPKVGFVRIVVDQPGTEILVDDVSAGAAPLSEEIRINAGRRRVTAVFQGTRKTKVAQIAGGDHETIEFVLAPEQTSDEPVEAAPPVHDEPDRTPLYLSWGATGLLAVGSATAGILALSAKSKQEKEKERLGVTEAELDRAASRVKSLALTTDIFMGLTAASAAVAIYITVKAPTSDSKEETALILCPRGAVVRGTF